MDEGTRSKLGFALEIFRSFLLKPKKSAEMLRQAMRAARGSDYVAGWKAATNAAERPARAANPFQDFYDARESGRGLSKWLHYLEIYNRHLGKFVGRQTRVLEVGVQSGGSLDMWLACFGPKSRVWGVDVDERCRAFESERSRIFIGDQADRGFWRRVKAEVGALDVLIDDAGHRTEGQIVTLEEMLPFLRPGGVYLCEDVLDSRNAFMGYAMGLASGLNEKVDSSPSAVRPTGFQSAVGSIHLYPYVVVIERSQSPAKEFTTQRRGTEWIY